MSEESYLCVTDQTNFPTIYYISWETMTFDLADISNFFDTTATFTKKLTEF